MEAGAGMGSLTAPRDYAWGPNGHIVNAMAIENSINGPIPGGYETIHWDGAFPQLATQSNGSIVDYKFDLDGEMQPQDASNGGPFFYERGLDGRITNEYGSSGNSGLFYPQNIQPSGYGGGSGPPTTPAPGAFPAFWTIGAGPTLAYWQSDGLFDGTSTIHGVRNISPDTGQWTTPDAYEGDMSDPRTQSKYMWDNNNPEAYSDPSGYADTCSQNEGGKSTSCKVNQRATPSPEEAARILDGILTRPTLMGASRYSLQ